MTDLQPGALAVVTGGASGIGLGITESLVAAGLRVEVLDLNEQALADVEKTSPLVDVHRVDVTDPDAVASVADEVLRLYGPVSVLVNNAGIGPAAPLLAMTLGDWKRVMDINLMGVVHGLNAFLPPMLERGSPGHIVNTSSMSALDPLGGLGAYAASKAAVSAMTDALRAELKDTQIRVSLLVPANVRTNIAENSTRLRPAQGTGFRDYKPSATSDIIWRTPAEVGQLVVSAIRGNLDVIATHPEQWPRVEEQHARVRRAFHRDNDGQG